MTMSMSEVTNSKTSSHSGDDLSITGRCGRKEMTMSISEVANSKTSTHSEESLSITGDIVRHLSTQNRGDRCGRKDISLSMSDVANSKTSSRSEESLSITGDIARHIRNTSQDSSCSSHDGSAGSTGKSFQSLSNYSSAFLSLGSDSDYALEQMEHDESSLQSHEGFSDASTQIRRTSSDQISVRSASYEGVKLASEAVQMLELNKGLHIIQDDSASSDDAAFTLETTEHTSNTSANRQEGHSTDESQHVSAPDVSPLLSNNTSSAAKMHAFARKGDKSNGGLARSLSTESHSRQEVGRNLSAYLPRCVLAEIVTKRLFLKAYGQRDSLEEGPAVPRQWPTRYGGILMVDVSSFTKLTVKLSRDAEHERQAMDSPSGKLGSRKNSDSVFRRRTKSDAGGETTDESLHGGVQGPASTKQQNSQSSRRQNSSPNRRHGPIRQFSAKSRLNPAEKMSLILNDYFGKMIHCIERLGGDVIKFAGDALLCYFPADVDFEHGSTAMPSWSTRRSVLLRMARCSLELLRDCSDYDIPFAISDSADKDGAAQQRQQIKLNLHVMCSVLPTTGMHVGGLSGRLEFVMTADNFNIVGELLNCAKRGEVAYDKEMWEGLQSIEGRCEDSELIEALKDAKVEEIYDANLHGQVTGYRVLQASLLLSQTKTAAIPLSAFKSPLKFLPSFSPASAGNDPFIRTYVPHNVLHYHDFNQASLLCENRTVSVVFFSLPPKICSTFETTQNAMVKIQRILRQHEGMLRQFMVDDKATVAISVWGCPPMAHMDDAARAVKAALDMRSAFAGGECYVGVASGRCYCGTIGTGSRCEYVVIGEAVNFAARLMGFSMKMGGDSRRDSCTVLCDENTGNQLVSSHGSPVTSIPMDAYEYCKFQMVNSGRHEFKGVGSQLWYELREINDDASFQQEIDGALDCAQLSRDRKLSAETRSQPIVGRDIEIKMITGALSRSLGLGIDGLPLTEKPATPPPYLICVHGPMGIGKSTLAAHLVSEVDRLKSLNSSATIGVSSSTPPNEDGPTVRNSCLDHLAIVELACNEQERKSPWFAIRGLLPLLWDTVTHYAAVSENVSAELECDPEQDFFEDKPDWWRSIALLTDLSGPDGSGSLSDANVPFRCLELVRLSSSFAQTLSGETRLSSLLELMMHLISLAIGDRVEEVSTVQNQYEQAPSRVLLLVDDLQSCDSNALQFLKRYMDLCEKQPGKAMLHFSVRPGASIEVKEVRDRSKQIIRLQRLNSDAINQLVLGNFGLESVANQRISPTEASSTVHADSTTAPEAAHTCSKELRTFIERNSAGVPLFAIEACRYLRRKELVTFDEKGGLLRLTEEGERAYAFWESEAATPVEATQQSVRVLIDGLSPDARMLLKCSSLMPQQFRLLDVVLLAQAMNQNMMNNHGAENGVHIGENGKGRREALKEIGSNGLWERSAGDPRHFRFSHKLMREVVYSSMTGAQRTTLHGLYFFMIEGSIAQLLKGGDDLGAKAKKTTGNRGGSSRNGRHSLDSRRPSNSYRRRRAPSPHSFASSSLEWRASNAAAAGIHDHAAMLYFLSAKDQYKAFSYAAADSSISEALLHLEEWEVHCRSLGVEPYSDAKDGAVVNEDTTSSPLFKSQRIQKKGTRARSLITISDNVEITRLRGLLCCLLDRPLEGKPFLEISLDLAGEDAVLAEENVIPLAVAEETALQHVHRMFNLEGAPNIDLLDRKEKIVSEENCVNVSDFHESRKEAKKEARTRMAKECAAAFDQLARVYLQSGEPMRGIYSCLRGLNLAEMVGECEELAKAYSTYAFVKKSPFYGSRAREVAVGVGELAPVTGFCAMLYGGMLIGEGEFAASEKALSQAVKVSMATNDLSTLGLSLSVLGWSLYVSGRFEESLKSSRELQRIGEEKNDPRFKNWGLTSRFRSVLALGNMDAVNEMLPRMQRYIDEFGESMYNSDKIAVAGMMITMRLLENDLVAVRESMDHWKDVVELVLCPCTQLVEFSGCVGIIEGMIATCQDNMDENLPRLNKALDAFDDFSIAYPVFRSRGSYLRGKTCLETREVNDANEEQALKHFRESVAWARRFTLPHEEELVRKLPNKAFVDMIFFERIVTKVFNRIDSALDDGIDYDQVSRDFRELLAEVDGKEEYDVWVQVADDVSSRLACLWGDTNPQLLHATQLVRADLLFETSSTSPIIEDHGEVPCDATSDASEETLAVLAYCMAAYRTRQARGSVATKQ